MSKGMRFGRRLFNGWHMFRLRAVRTVLLLALVVIGGVSCRRVEQSSTGAGASQVASEQVPVITTATGIEMVLVPTGSFRMGSVDGESDEAPVHEVHIDSFLMDRTEMTQEHCAELARGNPWLSGSSSHFKGLDRPVEMVGWDIAALYCNERSRKEGFDPCYDEETGECNFEANGYRLPTEAEWEYACRAGSDTEYHFGPDARVLNQHAWYADNSGKKTHPVGQKKPNAWGLFDMHGNVAEWCNDAYGENYYGQSPADNPRGTNEGERYVLRGGAWDCRATACRAARRVGANRGFADACFAQDAVGFRCVRRPSENGTAGRPATTAGGLVPAICAGPQVFAASRPQIQQQSNPVSQEGASVNKTADSSLSTGTGLLYGDIFLRHNTGAGHPERPERLTAIVERLDAGGLLSKLIRLKPAKAADRWLTTVHKAEYIERVRTSCEEDMGYVDSRDAPACEASYDVATMAAGGVLASVDAVMEGRIQNAFCAVRPPGHHALPNRAMGFCLLNNVAIAARYIQQKHNLPRVLIVDWDVHHGNGTQDIFYDDPTVLYFSVHRYPFYPGTGSADQQGKGKGVGYTINVPLPAGAGDKEFVQAVEDKLRPAALKFRPDFVLVSAGFDAHRQDPLGGMNVTADGFAQLTRVVKEIADKCAHGRLVSVLEGGYDLEGLSVSVEAHLRVLMDG